MMKDGRPDMQNWHDYLQYAAVKLLKFNFL